MVLIAPAAQPAPIAAPPSSALLVLTPAPQAEIGGSGPMLVTAHAPDGHWVMTCQARSDTNHDGQLETAIGPHGDPYGDELVPYFVESHGTGERVDDFLGSDASGRYVVLVRGQALLRDTETGRELTLGDATAVDFGEDGRELAYARKQDGSWQIVVRTLATGDERVLDPGSGELVAFELYDRARAVRVHMKRPNPNGMVDAAYSTQHHGRCAGHAAASYRWSVTHSIHEQRILSMQNTPSRLVTGSVVPFGAGWLHTQSDGAVQYESLASTTPQPLVPSTCKVGFSDQSHRIVATCRQGTRWALRLFEADQVRALGPMARSTEPASWPFGRHLLITDADANDTIVDVETATRRRTPTAQRLLAIRGNKTLLQRGPELVLLDGADERVLGRVEPYARLRGDRVGLSRERLILVGSLAVDMDRGELVGVVDGQPIAHQPFGFTREGWVLVQATTPGIHRGSEIAEGPMRWEMLRRPAAP